MPSSSPINPDAYLPRFRLNAFRPGQKDVIATVLAGQDCLCVMPTGGGKSLCYQLPALALDGVTLVVSPLIALMKDQVDQLLGLGLPVTFINSTLSLGETNARLDNLAAGKYKLAYVVPERFRSARFLEAVRATRLGLLAVDEAHCISEWGHDFRPDYARLGHFRRLLGRPTTIALTATATDAVRRDIVEQLDLVRPRTFITGFARPNLFYEVRSLRSDRQKADLLVDFLGATPGAGIVYASTRKKSEEVAETLAVKTGRRTTIYHAGLLPDQRRAAQDAFMDGRAEIVVATNAFGMGIDKADVRFVVHYNIPGSLEAYYQEAGRAGRDGQPSRCLLLYHAADRYIQEYFIESAYPSPENVAKVYEFLRGLQSDPIQLTQQDIKERLGLPIGSEGVGTCEQLLEGAGVLERLIASQNMACVRLDSELPTLVDLLPRQATMRRRVVRAVEKLVGPLRHELVHFRPENLARDAELDYSSVVAALRELNKLDVFTYVPPFRGRAIHMVRRDLDFDKLEIDFEALQQRKEAEYEKLNRVVRFSLSGHCRQQEILRYFGDEGEGPCGHCDNCRQAGLARAARGSQGSKAAPAPKAAASGDAKVIEAVRMVLSGVARTQARFPCGKNLIAQMLTGSASSRMDTLKLNKLSTFGLLKHLTQVEVVTLIEGLVATGHLEQIDLDTRRPVVRLTPAGTDLMRAKSRLEVDLPVPGELLAKLRGERLPAPAEQEVMEDDGPLELAPPDPRLLLALRKWRTKTAVAAGVPSYQVLSNAVLDQIARRRPRSDGELLRIKGFGPSKLRQYGPEIARLIGQETGARDGELAAVQGTVARAELPSLSGRGAGGEGRSPSQPPPTKLPSLSGRGAGGEGRSPSQAPLTTSQTPSPPSHYWTWRLLTAGFTAADCEQIRGLSRDTILEHAIRAVEEGLPLRVEVCLAPETIRALEQTAGQAAPPSDESGLVLARAPGYRDQEVALFLACRRAPRGA